MPPQGVHRLQMFDRMTNLRNAVHEHQNCSYVSTGGMREADPTEGTLRSEAIPPPHLKSEPTGTAFNSALYLIHQF